MVCCVVLFLVLSWGGEERGCLVCFDSHLSFLTLLFLPSLLIPINNSRTLPLFWHNKETYQGLDVK